MSRNSTPDQICLRVDKVNNIITQLKRAKDMLENSSPNEVGCDSLTFSANYTNQVLLDCIADPWRREEISERSIIWFCSWDLLMKNWT